MSHTLKETVQLQRAALGKLLEKPLSSLAQKCAPHWGQRDTLNDILRSYLRKVPHCTYLYALDTKGRQITDNVSNEGLLSEHYGRDRSQRPYMKEVVPAAGFLLSEAYVSLNARRPSLTALQIVRHEDEVVGFVGADFSLRDLPVATERYEEPWHWQQIKGDAAIRGTVFQQTRVDSILDKNIDQVISVLDELITERGVFQAVFHFSSSRATLWLFDDPYRYRLLQHDALTDPDTCFAYPRQDYPADATLPAERIRDVLENMRELRFADDTIYLRAASINIFNAMVSLTFSCDGSHYMRYNEFLDKNLGFWIGTAA